jgi:Protein of unknown function (DUF3443)
MSIPQPSNDLDDTKEGGTVLRLWFGILLGASIGLLGCGGSSSSLNNASSNPIAAAGSNVQAVNAGGGTFNPAGIVNGSFTTVTFCVPGSSNCTTIDGMLVDTGSTGVRVLSSALPAGFPLPHQLSGGSPVAECFQFVDGFTWGAVATADIKMASEVASSVPIEIIADPSVPNIPVACSNTGPSEQTVNTLGANGISGDRQFQAGLRPLLCDIEFREFIFHMSGIRVRTEHPEPGRAGAAPCGQVSDRQQWRDSRTAAGVGERRCGNQRIVGLWHRHAVE